jgi:hypothetical protein
MALIASDGADHDIAGSKELPAARLGLLAPITPTRGARAKPRRDVYRLARRDRSTPIRRASPAQTAAAAESIQLAPCGLPPDATDISSPGVKVAWQTLPLAHDLGASKAGSGAG